jgi:hypothetical protein
MGYLPVITGTAPQACTLNPRTARLDPSAVGAFTSGGVSMFQRSFLFAISTFIALMSVMGLVPLTSVQAQTTVNYTFEDGVLRGDPTRMQVPPTLLTEHGNTFMRITGSAGDRDAIPGKYSKRNRSTVGFTSGYSRMPVLSEANMSQTYSAAIRFHEHTGTGGVVFELFQGAPGGGGRYGTRDGTGPVVIAWRSNDHVFFRANYANETQWDMVDLGVIPAGSWHTYTVKAVWSHHPSQGRLEFYLDGQLKKTITGRDVNLGPASNRLPTLKLGLYGDHAVGSIDVDNVQAGPSRTGPAPAPSVALSAPTNVRIVPTL